MEVGANGTKRELIEKQDHSNQNGLSSEHGHWTSHTDEETMKKL